MLLKLKFLDPAGGGQEAQRDRAPAEAIQRERGRALSRLLDVILDGGAGA